MRVLVLDIGGSHVKVFAPGRKEPVEIESGRHMTPRRMLAEVRKAINGLGFDAVGGLRAWQPVYGRRLNSRKKGALSRAR